MNASNEEQNGSGANLQKKRTRLTNLFSSDEHVKPAYTFLVEFDVPSLEFHVLCFVVSFYKLLNKTLWGPKKDKDKD